MDAEEYGTDTSYHYSGMNCPMCAESNDVTTSQTALEGRYQRGTSQLSVNRPAASLAQSVSFVALKKIPEWRTKPETLKSW